MTSKITFLTGHYYNSKRKAGFHWLAKAFASIGCKVMFLTCNISYISFCRKDYRLEYPIYKNRNMLINIDANVSSYINFTKWHPFQLRSKILNRYAGFIFKKYANQNKQELVDINKGTDLFVFESTYALLYFNLLKNEFPTSKFIYRVSDDIDLLNLHPIAKETENKILPLFDYVSVPSSYIYNKLKTKATCIGLDYHCIDKKAYNTCHNNPYKQGGVNLVFVGNSHFDYNFLDVASHCFPQYRFYIIGPLEKEILMENVIYLGEIPFKETIPYIKYASVGLQTRADGKGIESLSDSLKAIQYSFCGLPIIAPDKLRTKRENVFYYKYADKQTIEEAVRKAVSTTERMVDPSIKDWNEYAKYLFDLMKIQ